VADRVRLKLTGATVAKVVALYSPFSLSDSHQIITDGRTSLALSNLMMLTSTDCKNARHFPTFSSNTCPCLIRERRAEQPRVNTYFHPIEMRVT
jgi:hypothetical protein